MRTQPRELGRRLHPLGVIAGKLGGGAPNFGGGRPQPRGRGRRLHTLGVIAGKEWSGSPNLSSDSGCTCHSMFGVGCDGSLRANAPHCEGGIVSGPVRKGKYSNAIAALRQKLLAMPLSVFTPLTLYCMRICRWSCRFSPTPGR